MIFVLDSQIITCFSFNGWLDPNRLVQAVQAVISTWDQHWGDDLKANDIKSKNSYTFSVAVIVTKCFWTCSICRHSSFPARTSRRLVVKWRSAFPYERTLNKVWWIAAKTISSLNRKAVVALMVVWRTPLSCPFSLFSKGFSTCESSHLTFNHL